jgi:DNA-binding HxlR family transcriptional regulator
VRLFNAARISMSVPRRNRSGLLNLKRKQRDQVAGEGCDSVCEIARALAVVGDRWTLLIMREVGFGMRKFEEIQAYTGMSSHLLSTRLKRMEKQGLLQRRRYSTQPARYEYIATPKGKELDAVSLALRAWTLRWGDYAPGAEPAFRMVHKKSGEVIDASWQIPRDGHPFTFDDVGGSMSVAFRAERAARRAAFQAGKRRLGAT